MIYIHESKVPYLDPFELDFSLKCVSNHLLREICDNVKLQRHHFSMVYVHGYLHVISSWRLTLALFSISVNLKGQKLD